MSKPLSGARELAWQALVEYQVTGGDPRDILNDLADPRISGRDRAMAWDITLGAIRQLKKLDFVAQCFIRAPLASQKPEIVAAFRMGFYQLMETSNIPPFAAVDETVQIIATHLSAKDAGFVNAVLRGFLEEPGKVRFPDRHREPIRYLSIFYSHPEWLVERWFSRFGFGQTRTMLEANNMRPKTGLRVLARKIERARLTKQLHDRGLEVDNSPFFPDYIRTARLSEILKSELFKQGYLAVQDESQGLPLYLLNPRSGETVLDLCSAPGGKTIGLADMAGPDSQVLSIDIDRLRLRCAKENADRVGFANIRFICADLLRFAPKRKFRYILLDVPCSGLGTLHNRPELRWAKSEGDIRTLAKLQLQLLESASPLLSDDGFLVYSTCTTEPEEIEAVVGRFLKSNGSFRLSRGNLRWVEPFESAGGFYRTWLHVHGIGGGGFALLRRRDAA